MNRGWKGINRVFKKWRILPTLPWEKSYIGKTARNLYSRGSEHTRNYEKTESESFIHKHQQEKHHGMLPNFKAKILYSFKDSFSRQTAEGVCIRRCKTDILNTKSEWHQPSLWRVRSEINRNPGKSWVIFFNLIGNCYFLSRTEYLTYVPFIYEYFVKWSDQVGETLSLK